MNHFFSSTGRNFYRERGPPKWKGLLSSETCMWTQWDHHFTRLRSHDPGPIDKISSSLDKLDSLGKSGRQGLCSNGSSMMQKHHESLLKNSRPLLAHMLHPATACPWSPFCFSRSPTPASQSETPWPPSHHPQQHRWSCPSLLCTDLCRVD
jgi:hypothetical protein